MMERIECKETNAGKWSVVCEASVGSMICLLSPFEADLRVGWIRLQNGNRPCVRSCLKPFKNEISATWKPPGGRNVDRMCGCMITRSHSIQKSNRSSNAKGQGSVGRPTKTISMREQGEFDPPDVCPLWPGFPLLQSIVCNPSRRGCACESIHGSVRTRLAAPRPRAAPRSIGFGRTRTKREHAPHTHTIRNHCGDRPGRLNRGVLPKLKGPEHAIGRQDFVIREASTRLSC